MWWEIFVSKLRIIFMYILYLAKYKILVGRDTGKKKCCFTQPGDSIEGREVKQTYTRFT